MCPACLATLAICIVGIGSGGGVAAFVAAKFRGDPEENAKDSFQNPTQEEESCPQEMP